MARITLQQAYDNHASAQDASDHAQGQLDDWSKQETDLTKARDDSKAAADHAETVLETVAAQVPNGSIAQTADGKLILAFGGQLHVLNPVSADQVTADDGSDAGPTDPNAPDAGTTTGTGTDTGTGEGVPPQGFFPPRG